MVGVPGRSKGCKTCKKRKIACSLEKPFCLMCTKSNRECGGYQQDRTFILDHRSREMASKVADAPAVQTPQAQSPVSSEAAQSVQLLHASIPTSSAFSSLMAIQNPTTRAAYREQIMSEFMYTFMPARKQILEDPDHYRPTSNRVAGNWFAMVPTLPDITSALESSTLAICTARLGRINGDMILVRESLKFYTQSLWELQKALWDPKLMYREETLAACMSLIIYEVFECPEHTINAWVNHSRGCSKLMEMRGPKAYETRFGHELFVTLQQLEVQGALSERRPSFLADPDWTTLPWKHYAKDSLHELLDMMAEMSDVVATGYQMFDPALANASDPTTLFYTIMSLVQRCWKLDAQLVAYYKRLQANTEGPLFWHELSKGFNESVLTSDLGCVFPVCYRFPNMRKAQTCMVFWATSCILWSGLGFIYKVLADFQVQSEPQSDSSPASDASSPPAAAMGFHLSLLPPLEHRTDVASLAKNICQSVEYCFKDGSTGMGPTICVFPMKVAIETLHDAPDCARELEWATATIDKITSTGSGMRMLKHLPVPITDHAYLPG